MDKVVVVKGKHEGKSGVVKSIDYNNKTITVHGVNTKNLFPDEHKLMRQMNKHRASNTHREVKWKRIPTPIPLGDVMLLSPHCDKLIKPKVSYKGKELGYVRVCPSTGKEIEFPRKTYRLPEDKHKYYKRQWHDNRAGEIKLVSFKGYDYGQVAEDFLNRLTQKNKAEKKLLLKDRFMKNFL
eukprot:CAMPEP_0170529386 /NCGR_PEP_ID=MMETSP0209-20121228/21465_1 /TAXON_ID=665100 ORGANISM="Litonotus pictus, Strain P1" /NCGR_SAMPLE_ID=MMETSP0209 /ASSEMBLY_ACC=CAM_ASM_000301 /LENGTH=181 /DNA_ID=CAMNT_0010821289 /DNA_START=575 /DNA_END=1120 /DNA_ORIENTATION=+